MGTSEEEIQVINSTLPKIAHIYWVWNHNWSSALWKNLRKNGWTMVNNKGLVTVKNAEGKELYTAIGKVTALALLVNYVHKEDRITPPEK